MPDIPEASLLECTDITGRRTRWFGSGCPNNPRLKEHGFSVARAAARLPHASGVIIDGARFASPASGEGPDAFFTCFCEHCLRAMSAKQYDADEIIRSVTALHDCINGRGTFEAKHFGGIRSWLGFRRSCISDHLREIARIVKSENGSMISGIFSFSPSLSGFVGQYYPDLGKIFDMVCPMLYHHYDDAPGTACLNFEIAALLKYIENIPAGKDMKEPVVQLFSDITGWDMAVLGSGGELIRSGFPNTILNDETALAKRLAGCAVRPIIYVRDVQLKESVESCFNGGADGADIFLYRANDKKYIENLRR